MHRVGTDPWGAADRYEPYVGRWSRLVAQDFVGWLGIAPGARWLDVGCGTGALSSAIIRAAAPAELRGVDPAEGFVATANALLGGTHFAATLGDAAELPFPDDHFDVVVSGLVLTFVPDLGRALAEAGRVARRGGTVGAYVWDYADRMQMIRQFWDAAAQVDPAARELDEAVRFAEMANPDGLRRSFENAGLRSVETRAIDIATVFVDFDDYWLPFLGGQGPAPAYCVALDEDRRRGLREALRERLPTEPDGTIHLVARAWAVRGSAFPG
jgi:ubiquinone/menaquinone biosynthesis C-methylase UbiE